ncbi:MAG TPA: hypothetical protein VH396_05225 [Chitinophagaceae bacterium]|jgi:hypothetical protein
MKAQLSVSPKSRDRYYFNYHIALQLYSIYKAETVIKNEPRVPLNYFKKPMTARRHRIIFTSYLKEQITSCISLVRTSGNNFHHTLASLLKN